MHMRAVWCLPTADDDLTLDYFAAKADTVPPADRDDLLKIGNLIAGGKHLTTTLAAVRERLYKEDWEDAIKAVDISKLPWIAEFESDLKVTFPTGRPVTPQTGRARTGGPMRVGKLRPPRFVIPGKPKETLGEFLMRVHQLDDVTLPVTMGSYVTLIDGKMSKRHVRRLCRDVRLPSRILTATQRVPDLPHA